MRAVVLESYGEPDVLSVPEVPDPVPGPEEVLVDVVATALNRADLLQRRGPLPEPADRRLAPPRPRSRAWSSPAGWPRWGSGSPAVAVGDEVMGIVGGGAYAERIVVHERQLMRGARDACRVADAAAIPEVWITAYDALVVQGGLTAGRVALVHAGGSGVGTAAIQIAKAIGRPHRRHRSAGKVDGVPGPRCRRGGRLRLGGLRRRVPRRSPAVPGVDVVLDVIGGDYVDRNIDALRVGGRIVQVGRDGRRPHRRSTSAPLLPKRATIVGTVLRARPLEEKIAITRRFAAEVLPLFDAGVPCAR